MLGQGYTAAPSPSSPCTPAAKAPGAGGEVAGLLGDSETPPALPWDSQGVWKGCTWCRTLWISSLQEWDIMRYLGQMKWRMLWFPHPFEVRGNLCSRACTMESCAWDVLRFYLHAFRVPCHLLKNCRQINPQSTWWAIRRVYFVLNDRKYSQKVIHSLHFYLFPLKLLSIQMAVFVYLIVANKCEMNL